jgi:phosphate transport system permease protein
LPPGPSAAESGGRARAGEKATKDTMHRRTKELIIKQAFLATAVTSLAVLGLIMGFLFMEGLPTFSFVSVKAFLGGLDWYPTDEARPDYGVLPLIAASGAVTALSSVLAIPLGVMSAVYLAEIASPRVRAVAKPVIEMLASLPSVVIGFFGMVVMAPFLQDFLGIDVGLNLFNASLMLAFMSVPTIASVSEDAIYAVPRELKEASLALGATHLETLLRVTIPAALSGIGTAVILGMSRAIGETMVVLMVAGGAAVLPDSLFGPVRPMPASIAAEMAEAPFRSPHYHALFAIAMVLFLVTLFFNVLADYISHKHRQAGSASL